MAKDVKEIGDSIGSAFGTIAHEVIENVSRNGSGRAHRNGDGALSGGRGLAVGAALAAGVPMAARAAKKLSGAKEAVAEKASDAGNVQKLAKKAGKKALPSLPGLGGKGENKGEKKGGKNKQGAPGVGKGRRMPVQQAVDIGVPVKVAYDQWTQFEEWPEFMHRLDQATQEDDCTVSFKTKIWGMSKEFVAQIEEQRPDERIQWSVNQGVTHEGVVTFHELAPNLTRLQVTVNVEPGSLIEKAGRGMRHVKRAVRADLARFKAFIEMREEPTGAWRGAVHEGEVVSKKSSGSSSKSSGSSNKSSGGRSRSSKSRSRSGSTRKRGTTRKKRGARS